LALTAVSIREKGDEMSLMTASLKTAAASASVAFSHAHTTSTAKFSTAKRFTKRTAWPTASKSAYYANFYAVDEATGALIE
jgi:hypothetical protein